MRSARHVTLSSPMRTSLLSAQSEPEWEINDTLRASGVFNSLPIEAAVRVDGVVGALEQ